MNEPRDLDAMYPALSALATAHGHSLVSMARPAPASERYIRLNGCCHMVSNAWHRHGAADAYSYLATVDALVGRLTNGPSRERLWRKLMGGTPTAFLDAVAEAAWALYFWDSGVPAFLDASFDPTDPRSKDADVAIVLDGTKHWLDVVNPRVQGPRAYERVAEKKYRGKFHAAVQSGPLQGASVGVLVCILRSEEVMVPLLLGHRPPAPPRLFERCQALNLVLIHTLRPSAHSDVLRPFPVLRWDRDQRRIAV